MERPVSLVADGGKSKDGLMSDQEKDRLRLLKVIMDVLSTEAPAKNVTGSDAVRQPESAAQPSNAAGSEAQKVTKKPAKAKPAKAPAPKDAKAQEVTKKPAKAKPAKAPAPKDAKAQEVTKKPAGTISKESEQSGAPESSEPKSAKQPSKKAVTPVKITAKKPTPIKPAEIKPAASQTTQEPKKILVKKPVPKKTAAKTATVKKAKKPSLIKSAKTPKKRKKIPEVPNTLEDELAIQLTPEEIDNFQIEKVDMEKLTHKVCDLLLIYESDGMLQSDLYKKLKLSARNGARLSLKLERMGMVSRIKLLVEERWTYKLVLKKTPISTASLENAPCLVCPVEQKCSLDGDISPRTCNLIEEWAIADLKRRS